MYFRYKPLNLLVFLMASGLITTVASSIAHVNDDRDSIYSLHERPNSPSDHTNLSTHFWWTRLRTQVRLLRDTNLFSVSDVVSVSSTEDLLLVMFPEYQLFIKLIIRELERVNFDVLIDHVDTREYTFAVLMASYLPLDLEHVLGYFTNSVVKFNSDL